MIASRFPRRRFLALSLGGAAVLVAACSQQTPATGTASSGASTTGSTTAPTAGATPASGQQPAQPATPAQSSSTNGQVVTIVMHSWEEDPKDTFWGPTIQQFEQQHPTIKIQRQWFPRADMHTKELALAATGQIGDVVRINVAPLVTELQIKGVLQPLDTYIKADKNWSDNDQPQFWPGNIATYTIQGQQWGYPMVGHPGDLHYYYNIDYLTKVGAGVPPVDTENLTFDYSKWKNDDLVAILKKANTVGADGRVSTYGILPGTGGEGTVAVLRAFGGNYYSDDGTKCLINTDESVAGLTFLSDEWNKLHAALPYDPNADYTQLFPGVRIGMLVSTAIAGNITRLVGSKFKWSVAPPPIGPIGKPATQVSSDGIGMSKITKHPQEAFAVIQMCTSKAFGVGRHLAGLGSPGSRYDVWTDPQFKKAEPLLATIIYDNLIDPKKAPPLMPWSHPANGSYNETDTTMTNILQDVYLGKKTPKEAADAAQSAVQAIMDKPPA